MDIKTIILQIINRGYETEIVEFKEAKNQFDFNKLGKYFSALSNEANLHNKKKAWLIFGIRDTDKTFINTNFRRNQKNLHGLKAEIANLIIDILSDILNKKQKENKVRNIIYAMSKRDKSIKNKGTNRYPKWVLSSSKNDKQINF